MVNNACAIKIYLFCQRVESFYDWDDDDDDDDDD